MDHKVHVSLYNDIIIKDDVILFGEIIKENIIIPLRLFKFHGEKIPMKDANDLMNQKIKWWIKYLNQI